MGDIRTYFSKEQHTHMPCPPRHNMPKSTATATATKTGKVATRRGRRLRLERDFGLNRCDLFELEKATLGKKLTDLYDTHLRWMDDIKLDKEWRSRVLRYPLRAAKKRLNVMNDNNDGNTDSAVIRMEYLNDALTLSSVAKKPMLLAMAWRHGAAKSGGGQMHRKRLQFINRVACEQGWWVAGGPRQIAAAMMESMCDDTHQYESLASISNKPCPVAWNIREEDLRRTLPNIHTFTTLTVDECTMVSRTSDVCDTKFIREYVGRRCGTFLDLPIRDYTRFTSLNAKQRTVVDAVQSSLLTTLVGDGGTGKSYTAAAVAHGLRWSHVIHLGPTHQVVKRMRDAAPSDSVDPNWKTAEPAYVPVHAFQTVQWFVFPLSSTNKKPQRAAATRGLPPLEYVLPYIGYIRLLRRVKRDDSVLIVIEEASMVTGSQFAQILRCADECVAHVRILAVGDPTQLPPVGGRGVPFSDLIEHEYVTPIRLVDNHRLNGDAVGMREYLTGVRACASKDTLQSVLQRGVGVTHLHVKHEAKVVAICVQYLRSFLSEGGRMWHCKRSKDDKTSTAMVICATNAQAMKVTKHFLRKEADANPFSVGQTVVCTQNTSYAKNGDLATVVGIGELASVPRTENSGKFLSKYGFTIALHSAEKGSTPTYYHVKKSHLKPADAITVHSAQGGEADFVIVMAPHGGYAHHMVKQRWVYTAASRAKQRLLLVGPEQYFTKRAATRDTYRTLLPLDDTCFQ